MSLHRRLAEPVDACSLAVVRMVVGAVGVLSSVRTLAYGWVEPLYAGPTHRFTYLGFGWVPQPSAAAVTALVVVSGLAAAAVALGWRLRAAAAVFTVAFTWVELIDVTNYLNHYYFLSLAGALLVIAPADRAWALSAHSGEGTVAAGWVWLLRGQVGVVYLFAGLAKLDGDWLGGTPLRFWLPTRADLPLIGPLLTEAWLPQTLAIAGAVFDCAIVPLLLWRRTRAVAWLAALAFHLATWALFPIGVFPWLMMGAATVFFEPAWPRRPVEWLEARRGTPSGAAQRPAPCSPAAPRWTKVGTALLLGYLAVQVLVPLRHLALPGDTRWTNEGYRFSWRVLLTEKAGTTTFVVTEPATGRTWVADPERYYTARQLRVMTTDPDLIHQAALLIARTESRGTPLEVRVEAYLSLNGHRPALLIDPNVDLAGQPRSPAHADWILPLPPD